MRVERFLTPSGPRYKFWCISGHYHDTRREAAECERKTYGVLLSGLVHSHPRTPSTAWTHPTHAAVTVADREIQFP